jgi:hypothetical protein
MKEAQNGEEGRCLKSQESGPVEGITSKRAGAHLHLHTGVDERDV